MRTAYYTAGTGNEAWHSPDMAKALRLVRESGTTNVPVTVWSFPEAVGPGRQHPHRPGTLCPDRQRRTAGFVSSRAGDYQESPVYGPLLDQMWVR
jgi:hypothetical protein